MSVRTRFAPSPTGYLHIGGIRTALFAWLFARHNGGTFILRVEDTDRERSTPEAVNIILEGLAWLGLKPDEGPYYQSERGERYQAAIDRLLDAGAAYYCYCSREELDEMRAKAMTRGEKPRYDGRCRERTAPPAAYDTRVVRFKNPQEGAVVFEDLIQGEIVYRNAELDDLIISRSDGSPTYNLTVVVDDIDMAITHVLRGDDHLNNTPRQINIMQAMGASLPRYAHIPLILAEDGKKLSKRHGAASVLEYREQGILPEALLNYLVRLGWSHGDQEIFTVEDMLRLFEVTDINRSAAALNPTKLLWLNQHYLKESPGERLAPLLAEQLSARGIDPARGPDLAVLCEVQKERVKTLAEMADQSRYFFEDFGAYDEAAAKKQLKPEILEPLAACRAALADVEDWSREAIHALIEDCAARFELKIGKIAQPLRVAVTGGAVSPSIDVTIALAGRDKTVARLEKAEQYIRSLA